MQSYKLYSAFTYVGIGNKYIIVWNLIIIYIVFEKFKFI